MQQAEIRSILRSMNRWAALLLFSLSACGYTRLYPGEPRDPADVARVQVRASSARIFLDGHEPKWYDRGVEVLPGAHEISGTIFAWRNRICSSVKRDCVPVTVVDRDSRGRIIGRRTELRCRCWQDCTEDEYRAICAHAVELHAGDERIFSVRITDLNERESIPQLQMYLREEQEEFPVRCDETQYGGKREFSEPIPCFGSAW